MDLCDRAAYEIVDLTHQLNEEIAVWDLSCAFHLRTNHSYDDGGFLVHHLSLPAGCGTHIDAPAHCIAGGLLVDALSLHSLIAPCHMIDLSHCMQADDYVTAAHIKAFESLNGPLGRGSLVIIRTGWERHWRQPQQYRNDLLFPSVSAEAALLLLERDVAGLAIDTLSPDRGDSAFPVHRLFLGAGKYLIENVANAATLPPVGAYCLALPLKMAGAEAPIRLVGLIPRQHKPLQPSNTTAP